MTVGQHLQLRLPVHLVRAAARSSATSWPCVREDGTARRGRGHLRLHGVRRVPGRPLQPVPDARAAGAGHQRRRRHGRAVPRPHRPAGARCRPRSIRATPPSWSRPRCRGTHSGWPAPAPTPGWPWSAPAASGSWPRPAPGGWGPATSRSRPAIPHQQEAGRAPRGPGRHRRPLRRRGRGGRERGWHRPRRRARRARWHHRRARRAHRRRPSSCPG